MPLCYVSPCCRLSPAASRMPLHPQIGADVIELGVPYSDPLADGPTIQAAATRALQQVLSFLPEGGRPHAAALLLPWRVAAAWMH